MSETATCCWTNEEYGDTWETTCGKAFILNDGETPREADMRYCCFCGHKLMQEVSDE